MAKIEGNIYGGFRGKLGNVVGYTWKGVWCVRSRPAQMRNPRSMAQQRHRSLFAEEVRLAGRMSWALNIGMADVADEMRMTPQNVFVKANQQAFGLDSDGRLEVDWESLIVSAGPVAPVALNNPQMDDEGVLTVTFEKNPMHLSSNNFDSVHLYIYCPALGQGYLAAPVYRKERRINVVLPEYYLDNELQLYAFVTDRDGRASDTYHVEYSIVNDNPETEVFPETMDIAENMDSVLTQDNQDIQETAEVETPPDSMQLSLFSPL